MAAREFASFATRSRLAWRNNKMFWNHANKPKLTWYVPRWFYVPRLWRTFRILFNSRSMLRIAIGSLVAGGFVVAGFKWMVPQLVIPDLWRMAFAIPGIVLLLGLELSLLSLFQPVVTLRRDRLTIQHGQSATILDPKQVIKTALTFHRENRVRLRIVYEKGGRVRHRVVGVPATVDFRKLVDMLPLKPTIRDARGRMRKCSKMRQSNRHRGWATLC